MARSHKPKVMARSTNGSATTTARLIRLETEVKSIKDDVSGLLDWAKNQGKTNWALIVSIAGIVASAMAGMATLFVGLISVSWVLLNAEVSGIHAQFVAADELRNVQHATSQRQDEMVWNALSDMGAKLPHYPNGPFYEPHVSTAGKTP